MPRRSAVRRSAGRRRPARVRALWSWVLACAVLVCAACSSPAEPPVPQVPTDQGRPVLPVPDVRPPGFTDPPPGSGLARYQRQPLAWTACGALRCATVRVPLDYARPDGTAITLSLTQKPATSSPRLGTLFVNPGGPGGLGVDYARSFPTAGLEGYDIVGWDPRGVGRSTPVVCPGADLDGLTSMDASPDDPQEQNALLAADRDFGAACLQGSGALLQHVSTVEVARDLDLMRGLVGDPELQFYGASYGTQIGATYADLYPRRVGRLVLDGAVNITTDDSITQARGFERALDGFADWCAGQSCPLGSSRAEVLGAIRGLWTRLDAEPLRVGNRRLTQSLGVTGVVRVLYAPSSAYPALLKGLQSAIDDGDGRLLLTFADDLNERDEQGKYGQINDAFPAVRCRDTVDRGVSGEVTRAQRAERTAPTVGPFFGPDLVCPMWPVAAVPRRTLVGAGAAPIVVVGTTGDPATPYEHAVSMSRQLRSAVLLTLRGFGHTGYGQSPCIQRLVQGYLTDGAVPADGTRC